MISNPSTRTISSRRTKSWRCSGTAGGEGAGVLHHGERRHCDVSGGRPDANRLIKNADIAMYSAKEAGKNQYAMFARDERGRQYRVLTTNRTGR